MGKAGLRKSALMLAAAVCGAGSSIAYFGVAGSSAMAPSTLGEYLRIALPPVAEIQGDTSQRAPETAQTVSDRAPPEGAVSLTTAGNPLSGTTANSVEIAAVETAVSAPQVVPAPVREVRKLAALPVMSYDLAGGAMSSNAIQTEKQNSG